MCVSVNVEAKTYLHFNMVEIILVVSEKKLKMFTCYTVSKQATS